MSSRTCYSPIFPHFQTTGRPHPAKPTEPELPGGACCLLPSNLFWSWAVMSAHLAPAGLCRWALSWVQQWAQVLNSCGTVSLLHVSAALKKQTGKHPFHADRCSAGLCQSSIWSDELDEASWVSTQCKNGPEKPNLTVVYLTEKSNKPHKEVLAMRSRNPVTRDKIAVTTVFY